MILSIIIPVYNVEKYIEKCLNSVIKQELKNIEILLVDDGSTDLSPKICEEYSSKDSRIKVFHKENGGLSDARNYGLKRAKGKYIAFVDSDDFIIENAYAELIKKARLNSADLSVGNAINYISENLYYPKKKKRNIIDNVYDGTEFMANSIEEGSMSMCSVLAIYRREFLINNKLFFEKGLLHEDELWTPQVYLHAKRVVYVDIDFYMHLKREGSITQSLDKTENGLHLILICNKLGKIYSEIDNMRYKKIFEDYIVTLYLDAFYIGRLYRKKYKKYINKVFFLKKSVYIKNKIKILIFLFNMNLYYMTVKLRKSV